MSDVESFLRLCDSGFEKGDADRSTAALGVVDAAIAGRRTSGGAD